MRSALKSWNEFGQTPEPKALIETGDLQAALSSFATREMLDYRQYGRYHSDGWICGFGVVQWLMGDTSGAAKVWSRACDEAFKGKFKYSSDGTFQSGLLLWFASVWLKDEDWREEAAALFDKLLRRRENHRLMGGGFSSLLAKFLRKEINLGELRAGYRDKPKHAWESYERRASFYAGVQAYEDGDTKKAHRLWADVVSPSYPQRELEYYLLVHERKKLSTQ